MPSPMEVSVTLPPEIAESVARKVASGAYASAADVVRAGLRALIERDDLVERWLHEEVVAGHAEYLTDPAQAVPAEALLARIKAARGVHPGL